MGIDIKIKTNPFHNKNYYLDMDFEGINPATEYRNLSQIGGISHQNGAVDYS